MLEEAMDELFCGEGAELVLVGIGRAVAKSDLIVFELDQAAVADGNPKDVRGEILEGRATIANRFAVDNPLLLPDSVRDIVGQAEFLKGVVELGLEDSGERFDWQQKVMAGRQPGAMIGR